MRFSGCVYWIVVPALAAGVRAAHGSRHVTKRAATHFIPQMHGSLCPECGATYSEEGDSCAARFDQLLALDHSRREPWGSRHGQAYAAFALQSWGL
jgi:hypothetical protein